MYCFPWSQEPYYSTVDERCSASTPPRVEVVSGLVRQENFIPCRRLHEDGPEASKLATVGGARTNYLGAPAVAKKPKPGDPLKVEVETVVDIP